MADFQNPSGKDKENPLLEPHTRGSQDLYENGELHGLSRWWDEAGRLRRERLAQFGAVIWRKDYDEDGKVVSEWHLDENSDEARRVRELLAEKKT